jgi:hypothetical protein
MNYNHNKTVIVYFQGIKEPLCTAFTEKDMFWMRVSHE